MHDELCYISEHERIEGSPTSLLSTSSAGYEPLSSTPCYESDVVPRPSKHRERRGLKKLEQRPAKKTPTKISRGNRHIGSTTVFAKSDNIECFPSQEQLKIERFSLEDRQICDGQANHPTKTSKVTTHKKRHREKCTT